MEMLLYSYDFQPTIVLNWNNTGKVPQLLAFTMGYKISFTLNFLQAVWTTVTAEGHSQCT